MSMSLQPCVVISKSTSAYLGVGALMALMAWACEEWGPRVYTAQAYQADASCLEAYAPIGRVEAAELGASCEPACLLLDDTLYVSTVCHPYPPEASVVDPATNSDCGVALELLAAGTACDDAAAGDADAAATPADAAPGDAAVE